MIFQTCDCAIDIYANGIFDALRKSALAIREPDLVYGSSFESAGLQYDVTAGKTKLKYKVKAYDVTDGNTKPNSLYQTNSEKPGSNTELDNQNERKAYDVTVENQNIMNDVIRLRYEN